MATETTALIPKTFDEYKIVCSNGIELIPVPFVIQALQSLELNPCAIEVQQCIEEIDRSNDGGVTAEGFEQVVERFQGTKASIEATVDNFLELNPSKTGVIVRKDFREKLRLAGREGLTDREFNAMWDSVDVDGTGEITAEQFVLAMCPGSTPADVASALKNKGVQPSSAAQQQEVERKAIVINESEMREINLENVEAEEWEKLCNMHSTQALASQRMREERKRAEAAEALNAEKAPEQPKQEEKGCCVVS